MYIHADCTVKQTLKAEGPPTAKLGEHDIWKNHSRRPDACCATLYRTVCRLQFMLLVFRRKLPRACEDDLCWCYILRKCSLCCCILYVQGKCLEEALSITRENMPRRSAKHADAFVVQQLMCYMRVQSSRLGDRRAPVV